ncbi:hypothetical protein GCM10009641_87350 [Mycobacterium cookii]|uniref:TIR domain-containing protein n=1 Tax=Nocardioides furvisabuli TaxID=375542 RepID=A0ABN2WJ55_9ACTN|nr:hypothetical protein [Nocardioides furvisabuli]
MTAPQKRPEVFVSYVFADPVSRQMRSSIERHLSVDVTITDGNHLGSGDWAAEIRRRMDRAKYAVVDVTGPSREVMFEYGFAGNKEVVLCVRNPGERAALPTWVTGSTVHTYAGADMPLFAASLDELLRRVKKPYQKPRLRAVPGEAVWLQSEDSAWCDRIFARIDNLAKENRVTLTRVYPEQLRSFQDTLEYVGGQFVFACIDGGEQDYAAQFFIGDLVARPDVGTGKRNGLSRQAFVLTPEFSSSVPWIADSVRRLPQRHVEIPTAESRLYDAARSAFRACKGVVR